MVSTEVALSRGMVATERRRVKVPARSLISMLHLESVVSTASRLLRVDREAERLELETAALAGQTFKERCAAIRKLNYLSEKVLVGIIENPNELPLIKAEAIWNPHVPNSALDALMKRPTDSEDGYVRYSANTVMRLRGR